MCCFLRFDEILEAIRARGLARFFVRHFNFLVSNKLSVLLFKRFKRTDFY